jgi:outer membrane protein assembly factor BamB
MAAVVAPATTLAAVGDWSQFRESQTHQAHNTAEQILTDTSVAGLGLAWTGATGGAVNSSPATANGVVYVGSADGKLYAFPTNCSTGAGTCAPLWTASTGGAIDSSPAAAGNSVYVGSADGKVYAFAVGCATGGASCSPTWTGTTGAAIHSSPAVDNGVVYVGSNDGKLYAFAVGCATGGASCSPTWTATTGAAIESSPAIASGVVYVGSDDNNLYAFAAGCATGGSSCSPLWTAPTGGHVYASPSVLTGVVYVGSLDGKLYAFDGAGVTGCTAGICSPIWTATTGGPIYSSPSVGDGRVWTGSDDGKVYAYRVNCATGGGSCTPQWSGDVGHAIRSSSASAHDVLYVGASDGTLYAFDADCGTGGATCSPAWSRSIGTAVQSSPAVSDGVVYVGSADGKLYAFDLATGTGTYHPLTPTRILDTRVGTGLAGPFSSHLARTFQVTGGTSGVPGNATAVTGNLTVTDQTSLGYLYLGPIANDNPTSSTLNFPVADDRANGVTVALGGGTLSVTFVAPHPGPTTDAIFDVTGYFTPDMTGATYHALTPARILDSRTGTGLAGTFSSHVARTFAVVGQGGVPGNATAVTGNLTVTGQTSLGYLYLGPVANDNPTSSTLNFPLADDRANGVTVALGGGTLSVTFVAPHPGPTTYAIFDVTGYFTPDATGATYHPLTPARILDSRFGTGLAGTFSSHVARTFAVVGQGGVPAGAIAVTGNLTVTSQTSLGYLYLGPDANDNPTSSTLNFPLADDRANGVTVALGGGMLSVTFVAPHPGPFTYAIFDVTGYFVPAI